MMRGSAERYIIFRQQVYFSTELSHVVHVVYLTHNCFSCFISAINAYVLVFLIVTSQRHFTALLQAVYTIFM